ncbi:MAG: portal protein, partial [Pseudomonadota bacterium]
MERFYINFWDGAYGDKFKNKPKPQFNKLWRSINRIASDINDMELNAVIVSNSHEATDDGAELLQRRWRNDFQSSDGAEASEIATMEACVGGLGATKWVAKYEDEENPDPDRLYLCNEIIQSACTSAWWDSGSNRKDKSDARWGWHLIRTNRKAREEEFGVNIVSFMNPPTSISNINTDYESSKDIYLAHYYEVIEKTLTTYDFSLLNGVKITSGDGIKDELGNSYTREDLKEIREIYLEEIGEEAPTTRRKVKYVEYALADGEKYLTKPQRTPFKRVPIFPRYGYYATINGQEFFCGEVRKQLDAEMFHNLYASNMMSILNESPVQKPIFAPIQVAKYATSWSRANIDDTPFLFADPLKDANGNVIVPGPLGYQQPPQLGTGHAAVGQFLEQNLMQSNGTGQATTPANTSGEAIQQVNERNDDAYLPLVKNTMFAKRAECEAWIPAAQKVYFTNSMAIRVQESDGSYTNVTTLEMTTDMDGNYGPYGNNPRGKYTVQIEQGEAYKDTVTETIQ